MQAAIASRGNNVIAFSSDEVQEEIRRQFSTLSGSRPPSKGLEAGISLIAGLETVSEIDELRQDKLKAVIQIEKYKKITTWCLLLSILSSFLCFALLLLFYSSSKNSSFDERERIDSQDLPFQFCSASSFTPNLFESFVGTPLLLTELIESGQLLKAKSHSSVKLIMQSETSYSGFLSVGKHRNLSRVFFWFFSTKNPSVSQSPLVLWIGGQTGWSSLIGLFKENGPFLVGLHSETFKPYLVTNDFSWHNEVNMLYIDIFDGTGFSKSESNYENPNETEDKDEENSHQVFGDDNETDRLLEALRQFMILYSVLSSKPSIFPVKLFVFSESFGASSVLSLSHKYLEYRGSKDSKLREKVQNFTLIGLGLGSPLISPKEQLSYADALASLIPLSFKEMTEFKKKDERILRALSHDRFEEALEIGNEIYKALRSLCPSLSVSLSNLKNNLRLLGKTEYICFLNQAHVRKGIHVGNISFSSESLPLEMKGPTSLISKKPFLEEALNEGLSVLLYGGDSDPFIHVLGLHRLIDSLNFTRMNEFKKDKGRIFKFPHSESFQKKEGGERGVLTQGGGLVFALISQSSHMVSLSHPSLIQKLMSFFVESSLSLTESFDKETSRQKLFGNESLNNQSTPYSC